jgi:hypothetical protein
MNHNLTRQYQKFYNSISSEEHVKNIENIIELRHQLKHVFLNHLLICELIIKIAMTLNNEEAIKELQRLHSMTTNDYNITNKD